jgi:hypothetical protein
MHPAGCPVDHRHERRQRVADLELFMPWTLSRRFLHKPRQDIPEGASASDQVASPARPFPSYVYDAAGNGLVSSARAWWAGPLSTGVLPVWREENKRTLMHTRSLRMWNLHVKCGTSGNWCSRFSAFAVPPDRRLWRGERLLEGRAPPGGNGIGWFLLVLLKAISRCGVLGCPREQALYYSRVKTFSKSHSFPAVKEPEDA